MSPNKKYLLVTVGTCLLAASGQAHAQSAPAPAGAGVTELETVVVTAEHRQSNTQKIAASISVRSGGDLTQQGKTQLQDILEDVPGVVYTGNGSAGTQPGGADLAGANLTIRGIQSNASVAGSWISAAPSAALYVDDVYEGLGNTYDIDRVEVLSGPQGTLYGRSATSGVVAIHSPQPNPDRVEANLSAEFGNYDLKHESGALNVPLVQDQLALRVAGDSYERDGYISAKGGQTNLSNGKVELLYKPNADVTVLLGYAKQGHIANSGGGSAVNFENNPNDPQYVGGLPVGRVTTNSEQYWANIKLNLGFATLTYIPTLRDYSVSSPNTVEENGDLVASVKNFIPTDRFITQEVRLTSNPGSALTWQAGALYYYNGVRNSEEVDLISPVSLRAFALTLKKDTLAVGTFAEATYALAPDWRVTGGVRYDYTHTETNEIYNAFNGQPPTSLDGSAGIREFNNFTFKLRAEHDLSPVNMLYASVSTGFSPGDVSITTGAGGAPIPLVLAAETLTAYELGSKNQFFDRRLQINGDVFYYDYAGYQTQGINISGSSINLAFTTLAAPVQVLGGELETQYLLTPYDRLTASLELTDARYVSASQMFQTFVARSAVAHVVPVTFTPAYSHTFDLPDSSRVILRAEGRYLSAHDAGNLTATELASGAAPLVHVPDNWLGDLEATWTSANGKYSITAYARNIGNTIYKTDVTLSALGVGNDAAPYEGGLYLNDPRTYGVVLSAKY
jgi:iron complex outermembrane receptor protein